MSNHSAEKSPLIGQSLSNVGLGTADTEFTRWINKNCVCGTCIHGVDADLFGFVLCEQPGMAGGWNRATACCEEHDFRDAEMARQFSRLEDAWYAEYSDQRARRSDKFSRLEDAWYAEFIALEMPNAALSGPQPTAVLGNLSSVMAGKIDDILREAVTRFLGRADWTENELKGHLVRQVLPNGAEYFCMDGVALVEFHPLAIDHETKCGSMVITTTRQYRFLVPNA